MGRVRSKPKIANECGLVGPSTSHSTSLTNKPPTSIRSPTAVLGKIAVTLLLLGIEALYESSVDRANRDPATTTFFPSHFGIGMNRNRQAALRGSTAILILMSQRAITVRWFELTPLRPGHPSLLPTALPARDLTLEQGPIECGSGVDMVASARVNLRRGDFCPESMASSLLGVLAYVYCTLVVLNTQYLECWTNLTISDCIYYSCRDPRKRALWAATQRTPLYLIINPA